MAEGGCFDQCITRRAKENNGDIDELVVMGNRTQYLNDQQAIMVVSGLVMLNGNSEDKYKIDNAKNGLPAMPLDTKRPIIDDTNRENQSSQKPKVKRKLQVELPVRSKSQRKSRYPEAQLRSKYNANARELRPNISKINENKGATNDVESHRVGGGLVSVNYPSRSRSLAAPESAGYVDDEGSIAASNYTTSPRLKNLPGGREIRKASIDSIGMEHYKKLYKSKVDKDAALQQIIETSNAIHEHQRLGRESGNRASVHIPLANTRGFKEVRIAGVYRIVRRLGSGSFGEVYEGLNVNTGDKVAIKLEHLSRGNPHLIHEAKVYAAIHNCSRVPKILWIGIAGEFTCMVIELLGPSLEDRFQYCGKKFDLMKVSQLGVMMLDAIMQLHDKSKYIHRDIKPHNFLLGRGSREHQVSIIDFGLARKYIISGGRHLSYSEGHSLTGTARYVSINTHIGIQQSRRDDMESIGYCLIYFLKGQLPWQGITGNKDEKYLHIMKKKTKTKIADLCEGLPDAYSEYIHYCRHMKYDAEPDYAYLKHLIGSTYPVGLCPTIPHFKWNSVYEKNRRK